MARLYEYQGKDILKKAGVSVPKGICVSTAEEAKKAAKEIGKPVALKAQVWATGRFKAGGILFADTPEEAEKGTEELLNKTVKGLAVEKVLVEEKFEVDREFYTGVIVADSHKIRGPVVIASSMGGTGIEEIAAKYPDKVAMLNVDYLEGVDQKAAMDLLGKLNFDPKISDEQMKLYADVIVKLYQAFVDNNARSAEINPVVFLKDGSVAAADCRASIDDNSVFRHPEFEIDLPRDMDSPPSELDNIAWQIEDDDYRGTGYFTQMVDDIKEEGFLGFQGVGGGGAMLGASALIARGYKLANYADTSGDPTASKIYRVMKCVFSQHIDGYVLMGSCLANQEQWHHGHAIVKALKEVAVDRPGFPCVLLIAGNKEEETFKIIEDGLKDVNIRYELYGRKYIYDTDHMADRVEALIKEYQASDDYKNRKFKLSS
ncbi:ATP-grasp domain-containing protein [Spirochaetota bacterium]